MRNRNATTEENPFLGGGFKGNTAVTNERSVGSVQRDITSQMMTAQSETNDRLDALIAEQKRTNELLLRLLEGR